MERMGVAFAIAAAMTFHAVATGLEALAAREAWAAGPPTFTWLSVVYLVLLLVAGLVGIAILVTSTLFRRPAVTADPLVRNPRRAR